MAERRMFAKTIIDSDMFLDMPQSTQLLYFHLSMRADDDGFINNPKSIMRNCKCCEEDLRMLVEKKFIIPFESGVVVIKHWKIHNYIAKDRYKETKYKNEKAMLALDENNSYTTCIQNVDELETQVRLGKDRIGKNNISISSKEDITTSDKPEGDKPIPKPKKEKPTKHKYGEYNNVLLVDEEVEKLKTKFPDWQERVERLSEYMASTGKSYKSHYVTILAWSRREKESLKKKEQPKNKFNNFESRNYDFDSLERQLLDSN